MGSAAQAQSKVRGIQFIELLRCPRSKVRGFQFIELRRHGGVGFPNRRGGEGMGGAGLLGLQSLRFYQLAFRELLLLWCRAAG